MAVEQLPAQVREFANYLNGLMARLDQGGGWCGVFWQRDPDGMRACLDGREVPPWDVVEALLQDLASEYGPDVARAEADGARTRHAAALLAHDTRPGGRDALADRLDVMLREQRYAAERQAELGRSLTEAATQDQADALRLDLAWARDDHTRATARCAELRSRMAELDRRSAVVRREGAGVQGAGFPGGGAVTRASGGRAGGASGWGPGDVVGQASGQRSGAGAGEASGQRSGAGAGGASGQGLGGDAGVALGWGSRTAGQASGQGSGAEEARGRGPGVEAGDAQGQGPGVEAGESFGWGSRAAGGASGRGSSDRAGRAFGQGPGAGDAQGQGPGVEADESLGWGSRAAGGAFGRGSSDRAGRAFGQGPGAGEAQAQGPGVETGEAPGWGSGVQARNAATRASADHADDAWPQAPGAHADDPGARAAGTHADTHGSQASGTHAPGPQAPGIHVPGPQAPDAHTHAPGPQAPGTHTPSPQTPGTHPAQPPAQAFPSWGAGTPPGSPTPAPVPKQRKRRRGGARFAGMDEEAAAPVVVPPTAVPSLLEPSDAPGRRTPRGARFAGAAEVVEPAAQPLVEPVDGADRQEVAGAVERLLRLRRDGRSGEAHALLAEITYSSPGRYPLLAVELQRAGLGADWATLLWEAASLPADRLVAAADALVAAGREGDAEQIMRQGVVRSADEVGQVVLALAEEGRRREMGALLDAYVRVRTPEEAARSVAADPGTLVPLLLEAARGVSDERHWDLVHALRVAGFAA
ncbi:hypothetical protein ACWD1Z_06505 [Streptomyces sp. NPDC002784]